MCSPVQPMAEPSYNQSLRRLPKKERRLIYPFLGELERVWHLLQDSQECLSQAYSAYSDHLRKQKMYDQLARAGYSGYKTKADRYSEACTKLLHCIREWEKLVGGFSRRYEELNAR